MNIRSITTLMDATNPFRPEALGQAGETASRVRSALAGAGLNVQTLRIATQPVARIVLDRPPQDVVALVQQLDAAARSAGIDYVALGPVQLGDPIEWVSLIPAILSAAPTVFCSVEIARQGLGLSLRHVREAGRTIQHVGPLTPDGFSNLRLAVLANVRPWGAFFPAAYHGGGPPRIAIAIEGADLAVEAFRSATSLASARDRLIAVVEGYAHQIEQVVEDALAGSDARFQGIDFTLGTFPEPARSIGAALESLGLEKFGLSGSLAAAAFLTDALDRAQFRRTGFCGLMLPVLEDAILAQRAAEGQLTMNDLLMFSAVCGTGLDTIPLPGDISEEQIAAILADVGALALRLGKQLTARLMPLPGKKAGDPTSFEFEYFANSRVLPAPSATLTRLFAQDEILDIQPRSTRSQGS